MTIEEQLRLHEQWLQSIDSNLDRITAAQAEGREAMARMENALAVVAQNQSWFSVALNSLTHRLDQLTVRVDQLTVRVDQLAQRMDQLAENHLRLEQTFERFLRLRTNGEPN